MRHADLLDGVGRNVGKTPRRDVPERVKCRSWHEDAAFIFREEGATMAKNERIVLPADPADLEDFDVTEEAMDRALKARLIRVTRTKMGLSQPEFAARFHVPVETLNDWERSRATAPDFAIAYFRVIATHPDLVTEALADQP
jgi:putative transcriptional regulator